MFMLELEIFQRSKVPRYQSCTMLYQLHGWEATGLRRNGESGQAPVSDKQQWPFAKGQQHQSV
jgi:hypothetical protein